MSSLSFFVKFGHSSLRLLKTLLPFSFLRRGVAVFFLLPLLALSVLSLGFQWPPLRIPTPLLSFLLSSIVSACVRGLSLLPHHLTYPSTAILPVLSGSSPPTPSLHCSPCSGFHFVACERASAGANASLHISPIFCISSFLRSMVYRLIALASFLKRLSPISLPLKRTCSSAGRGHVCAPKHAWLLSWRMEDLYLGGSNVWVARKEIGRVYRRCGHGLS